MTQKELIEKMTEIGNHCCEHDKDTFYDGGKEAISKMAEDLEKCGYSESFIATTIKRIITCYKKRDDAFKIQNYEEADAYRGAIHACSAVLTFVTTKDSPLAPF